MGDIVMAGPYRVENLKVYEMLCDLHLEICDLSHQWPSEERYELGSQVRRSSNSSPANLAEKHNDRHVRNRIEGVNRSRGEVDETIHHLYMAARKKYFPRETFESYRDRLEECVRMLNGLERRYEKELDQSQRKWQSQQHRS